MRTINFRGKRIDNGEWVYGYFTVSAFCSEGTCWTIQPTPRISHKVERETVGQFTGLHDKNGKEIYEGDINQYGYVIKYCEEKALFGEYGTRNGINYDILMSYPINSKSQIIKGNIYENPELLTD